MMFQLLPRALAATVLLSIGAVSSPIAATSVAYSADVIAQGKAFGFELQETKLSNGTAVQKWVPSQGLLDEQRARWENYYMVDPVTNATVLNPENQSKNISISKRGEDFNPYDGAECRMVFKHHHNIQQCCGGQHCEDCSYETTEFRILDHRNPDTNFAVFDFDQGYWQYFALNGHRGWWGIASWDVFTKWYGIDSAFGHIEGEGTDRNMKTGDWCWYTQGSAWWGYYGEAACTSYCSAFNW